MTAGEHVQACFSKIYSGYELHKVPIYRIDSYTVPHSAACKTQESISLTCSPSIPAFGHIQQAHHSPSFPTRGNTPSKAV